MYRAGSFAYVNQGFPGDRTTAECLDLAIEPVPDLATGNTVLAYEFGNRCDLPAVVDLAINVVGRTLDGREVALAPYDPDHEIHAMNIDGRAAGREQITYTSTEAIAGVCVDAAAIAHATPPEWKCFSWMPITQTTLPPQCNAVGDAFGNRQCPHFGAWAANLRVRHLFMELGSNIRVFPNLLPSGPQRQPSDVAMTVNFRIAMNLAHGFYAGIDGELGGLTEAGVLTGVAPSSGVVVAGALVAGARTTIGPAAFALEGAVGGLAVIYGVDGATIDSGRPLAELRGRAELWLDPWITGGAVVGTSVLESQDWMFGLYLGLHSRAFGGER